MPEFFVLGLLQEAVKVLLQVFACWAWIFFKESLLLLQTSTRTFLSTDGSHHVRFGRKIEEQEKREEKEWFHCPYRTKTTWEITCMRTRTRWLVVVFVTWCGHWYFHRFAFESITVVASLVLLYVARKQQQWWIYPCFKLYTFGIFFEGQLLPIRFFKMLSAFRIVVLSCSSFCWLKLMHSCISQTVCQISELFNRLFGG